MEVQEHLHLDRVTVRNPTDSKKSSKDYGRTKDNDPDVDVFLPGFVFSCDGVASRVRPQTDGDYHNRCGIGGLNLKSQDQTTDLKSRQAKKAKVWCQVKGLTSESTGSVWSLFFLCDLALPSKSQVTLGAGRPPMVAGILIGSPARMQSRSSAVTSMLMEGGTVHMETLVRM